MPQDIGDNATPFHARDAAPLDRSNSIYTRLRAAEAACGPRANKNDLADALIVVCLSEGSAASGHIISTITGFGFDLGARHIGARLSSGAGLSRTNSLWRKTGPNTYSLFDPDQPTPAPIPAAGVAVPTAKPAKPD